MLEEKKQRKVKKVARECKAMAEAESWSGCSQVKGQVCRISQEGWKKPKRTVKREVKRVSGKCVKISRMTRLFLRRFPFGLDEEGRGVELAFEAVKRVNVGEKYIAEPV